MCRLEPEPRCTRSDELERPHNYHTLPELSTHTFGQAPELGLKVASEDVVEKERLSEVRLAQSCCLSLKARVFV